MKVVSPWVRISVRYPSSTSILARSTTAASVETKGRYPHAEEASRPRSTSTRVPERAAPRAPRFGVLRYRIHPNLRALGTPMGHRHIQLSEFRHKQRSARPGGCGHGRHRCVMIGIFLCHNTQQPYTTSDVNAPMRRIIEEIIGIAHARHPGNL